jgi:hypothetical protein
MHGGGFRSKRKTRRCTPDAHAAAWQFLLLHGSFDVSSRP